ncbi:PBECR4 domain-containing protein [Butyrivibrio sp. AE3004]|uniref:PBECR4 domain-containing protein n=1 Tax=Butyrivibrio sp. AE3004 TaxID=1506994 RepID=UPI00068F6FAE|nr:PBECR4 domain-containing protein [Butyrivibrio sp. AE3004]
MEVQISFKERVKNCAIENAPKFNDNFINYEYCIISKAFSDSGYYITKALDGNYLHLVGVNTSMPPDTFFKKCLNRTLSENDFDFVKRGVGKNALKGTVREKIRVLPNMVEIIPC